MHRLKEGIRFDPLEFDKEYIFTTSYNDISYYFYNLTKGGYHINNKYYLIGELSLFCFDKSLHPICIVDDYENKEHLGSSILIDKDFFNGSDPDIKDEITKIIDYLKEKKYKITIVKNLESYIFEDIKLPDFRTIEDMNKWLDDIKKKWLKNERKKILKAEKKELSTAKKNTLGIFC